MKLLILCLLVFTSAGFVFGDEEEIKPNFIDLDENDDQAYEDSPEDFVEDEGDDYMLDEEDLDEEDDSEPKDPAGFKDDENDPNSTKPRGGKPVQIGEIKKPGIEEASSGMPELTDKKENQNTKRKEDGNLQDALVDKLGLNFAGESDDPDFVTKK
ncbi:rRNA-processing protein EFG1-like isoform X2 [Pocillopora damicornis]|uniref:rRNA-processing protein EFG1-like isoform X2 n=1 Tax=Pocillopora damicornis TaxID=46731 RepID=UPI000F554C5B|nr:rRNA-processing protein EFG1-like isoform X2 [Pocillopora damicornis]